MGFKAWETPRDLFEFWNERYGFQVDIAASHENALLPNYCTEEGRFRREGEEIIKLSDKTGLDMENWRNANVFCNPPYDSSLPQWVANAKFARLAFLLLPPSTDTRWFHEHIWSEERHGPYPGVELHFLEGRIRFLKDGVVGPAPRAGNMVAIFRARYIW